MGNQVTKHAVRSVRLKEKGKSTLAGRKLWFDDKFGRLNTEEKGQYLGSFEDEKILVMYDEGSYEIVDTELTQRFDAEKIVLIEKFDPEKIISAVYLDADKGQYNVKRFKIETTTLNNKFAFIKEGEGNKLEAVSTDAEPVLQVQTGKGQQVRSAKFKIAKMVEVMGWKAVGAKLMDYSKSIEMAWEKKEEGQPPTLFEQE